MEAVAPSGRAGPGRRPAAWAPATWASAASAPAARWSWGRPGGGAGGGYAGHLELRREAAGGVQLHVVLQGVAAVEPLGAKVAREGHFATVNEGVLKEKVNKINSS